MAGERKVWQAMMKFADGKSLTEREWAALSELSLVDRNNLEFGPGNVRWAATEAERASNLAFYRSLAKPLH